ncbi:DUF692 family multinuclear iron-containing protein [Pseudahrensia aquimaris]|uniref:UPF0276 protein ACFQ14_16630 n=1 Tax=Pseudahrensia aquimaris TaxID=744461 RepID=A0ABW3FL96_9HYPH
MVDTILDAPLHSPRYAPRALPDKAGAGLKAEHVAEILEAKADVGFFEVHAENYMGGGGLPHAQLRAIRENYPISLHGVGMSIGGPSDLNADHLARFKRLVEIYEPGMVSEHLAWSTHTDVFYNDLLPVPYTDETLANIVDHIDHMQTALGRKVLIENPSTYVAFEESTWAEVDFMAAVAKRSGCGLLFDVNNVYISAKNHSLSAEAYIDAYPLHLVEEIHLAGHAEDVDDDGNPLLIDTHDREVATDVWTLYERTLGHTGKIPSLVEWDNEVPKWSVLAEEITRTQSHLDRASARDRHAA